ncbi:GNAT family N-acetyltransferase [Pararhodobacter sp. SW119]|uniref:GNAT family N-acetyltransferase n=1 Tax=Pararhodobacter sp. SW119 TaxID=2780075 RepID=UPI001AE01790|nr:GNAT family N-acetyltransferase [Pararhodobacter sp. SW119]
MPAHRAGERVDYRVTWLEMAARPRFDWPKLPVGREALLLRAEAPPRWYLLSLYDSVGRDHAWTDLHNAPTEELEAWLADPDVALFTLMGQGWPQGFFLLDWRTKGICDLAYFGLVPEVVGRGLGSWLLQSAILSGWAREGVAKMTVNTCTLDHPRALIQYQRFGFAPVRTEVHSRVLQRDHVFQQPLL